MPHIKIIYPDNSEKTIEAPEGFSIMEICQMNRISEIEGACGGSLACATCHLYVHPDWWDKAFGEETEKSEEEEDMLDLAFDIRDKSRLCCQIQMTKELDGMVLALPGSNVDWA